jgi:hypothetical protein
LDSQPLEKKAESVVSICISKERRLIFVACASTVHHKSQIPYFSRKLENVTTFHRIPSVCFSIDGWID